MDSLGLLMPLSPDTVNQIANLINTTKSSFCIEKLSVQQQHGTSDCGLFAIGFAVECCLLNMLVESFLTREECVGIYANVCK